MNSFCLYACLDTIVRLFFCLFCRFRGGVCVWLFCPCCCWRLFWVFQVVWIFGERAWCAGRGGAAPPLPLLAHFLPGTPRVQPWCNRGTLWAQLWHNCGTGVVQPGVQPRHMWAHHGTTGTLRAHRGTPGSSGSLDSSCVADITLGHV